MVSAPCGHLLHSVMFLKCLDSLTPNFSQRKIPILIGFGLQLHAQLGGFLPHCILSTKWRLLSATVGLASITTIPCTADDGARDIKVRSGVPLTHPPLVYIEAPKPHSKRTEFSFRIVRSTYILKHTHPFKAGSRVLM